MRRRRRSTHCRCTGDPRRDPCAYCERRIDAAEVNADPLWAPDEPERGEVEYEKWLDRIGGST